MHELVRKQLVKYDGKLRAALRPETRFSAHPRALTAAEAVAEAADADEIPTQTRTLARLEPSGAPAATACPRVADARGGDDVRVDAETSRKRGGGVGTGSERELGRRRGRRLGARRAARARKECVLQCDSSILYTRFAVLEALAFPRPLQLRSHIRFGSLRSPPPPPLAQHHPPFPLLLSVLLGWVAHALVALVEDCTTGAVSDSSGRFSLAACMSGRGARSRTNPASLGDDH